MKRKRGGCAKKNPPKPIFGCSKELKENAVGEEKRQYHDKNTAYCLERSGFQPWNFEEKGCQGCDVLWHSRDKKTLSGRETLSEATAMAEFC